MNPNVSNPSRQNPNRRFGIFALIGLAALVWTKLDRALEQGAEAHRFMHERRNIGKVVLTT